VNEKELSIEQRILQAVKRTLAAVIRDTATPHGMRHPLSDSTIEDLRQCLSLISARERELAGEDSKAKPRFADESGGSSVVQFHPRKPKEEE
jgi:hypothetical protein